MLQRWWEYCNTSEQPKGTPVRLVFPTAPLPVIVGHPRKRFAYPESLNPAAERSFPAILLVPLVVIHVLLIMAFFA